MNRVGGGTKDAWEAVLAKAFLAVAPAPHPASVQSAPPCTHHSVSLHPPFSPTVHPSFIPAAPEGPTPDCVFCFWTQNLTNEEPVVIIQARTVLTLAEKVM